jgi:hypothetical protein
VRSTIKIFVTLQKMVVGPPHFLTLGSLLLIPLLLTGLAAIMMGIFAGLILSYFTGSIVKICKEV